MTHAHDIALDATDQRTYRLKDFRGRGLILITYPKDTHGACAEMIRHFDDAREQFATLGFTVVGMSRDLIKRHIAFKKAHNIDMLLLSDKDDELAKALNLQGQVTVFDKQFSGLMRALMVYDKDGNVIHRMTNFDPASITEKLYDTLKNG